jgi:Immunoglobulin domain
LGKSFNQFAARSSETSSSDGSAERVASIYIYKQLKAYVRNPLFAGSYILLWRRGTSVLTAANLMVTRDARFKLVDGHNLQIGGVRIQDAGDYVCQIGDQDARDQVHTVEILVPPSVRPVPQNGQITARKGSSVTLECKASGNPVPNLYWHKKVRKYLCSAPRSRFFYASQRAAPSSLSD